MNKKQWWVLAGLFFLLSIKLSWSANFYDDYQHKFGDLALEALNSSQSFDSPQRQLAISLDQSAQTFMISDNIYRMGSYFAWVLTLGFFLCGFLEPKQKH